MKQTVVVALLLLLLGVVSFYRQGTGADAFELGVSFNIGGANVIFVDNNTALAG